MNEGLGDRAGAASTLVGTAVGLDTTEQRFVEVLRRSRTLVPLSRLSRILGTSTSTLLETVEPHLCQRGLVRMTLTGRTATHVLGGGWRPKGAVRIASRA